MRIPHLEVTGQQRLVDKAIIQCIKDIKKTKEFQTDVCELVGQRDTFTSEPTGSEKSGCFAYSPLVFQCGIT